MFFDEIIFEDQIIVYQVKVSSKRKLNMSLQVLPDKSIVVKTPSFVSAKEIKNFVHSHIQWVIQKQHEQKSLKYQSNSLHLFLGEEYSLSLINNPNFNVYIENKKIVIESPNLDEQTIKKYLDYFYIKQAEIIFQQRLEYLLPKVKWVRNYPYIRIKLMRSRWGSCSAQGRISLNAYLMKANVDCIDYVILHELCHLVVKAHNKDFYALLSSVCPDWKLYQQFLKEIVL